MSLLIANRGGSEGHRYVSSAGGQQREKSRLRLANRATIFEGLAVCDHLRGREGGGMWGERLYACEK